MHKLLGKPRLTESYTSMMSQPRRIHWRTPTVMVSAFTAGVLLALGHHFFYYSLSGSIAPSESYQVLSETVSRQQVNLAVGTSLAFMSKSLFSLAVTASYTQVFWRALRKAQYKARLTDIDVVFSVTQDILGLFRASVWRRYSLPLTLAMIFWLLPIPFVITPATLTVQSALEQPSPFAMRSVPQFDFINPNFINFIVDPQVFDYFGPSQLLSQIATATAARGEILAIPPPALNASWKLEFWGPSIRCTNVSDPLRGEFLNNIGTYIQDMHNPPSYLAWTPWENVYVNDSLPFINGSSGMELRNFYGDSRTVFLAYDNSLHGSLPEDVDYAITNHTIVEGWPQLLSNLTILKCDLYNSSYALNFQYTNGAQHIDVSKTTSSQNPLTTMESRINLPAGPQGIWNDSTCNTNTSAYSPCSSQVYLQMASYYAIFNALSGLIFGAIDSTKIDSLVSNTVLVDTDELRFLSDQTDVRDRLAVSPAFQDIPFQPPQGTRGSLTKVLEQLIENITISVLSEPYLQPNYSSSYPSLANVTFETYRSVYTYNARTLWIAYGLAILFTAVTIVIGSITMYSNGVAYDASFSTVLRACRIQGKGVVPVQTDLDGDDGGQPLPKSLAKATIVMNTSRQGPAEYSALEAKASLTEQSN